MGQGFYKEEARPLPHSQIPLRLFLIVENAFCVAWQHLKNAAPPGFDIATAEENDVTAELLKQLHWVFDREEVSGFGEEYLVLAPRDGKIENFDGSKRDLMPDLMIILIGRPKACIPWQDRMFIECKPVGEGRAAGEYYCDKGLTRFIQGDYAWAMTSALMVGYAHSGYAIVPKLRDALEARHDKIPTLHLPQACIRSQTGQASDAVHITHHGRKFNYVQNSQPAPAITIRHLWLRRN